MDKIIDLHFNGRWQQRLKKYLNSNDFKFTLNTVGKYYTERPVLPTMDNVFLPFRATGDPKVLILGGTPHNTVQLSSGLPIGTHTNVFVPLRLDMIFQEIHRDFGSVETDPTLISWYKQGVMTLNTRMTIDEFGTEGHKIWRDFMKQVLLSLSGDGVVFLFMGEEAKDLSRYTDEYLDHQIYVRDPLDSPYRKEGFYESGVFRQINKILMKNNGYEITW
jgi:uracil DNA glycosylase